MLFQYFLKPPVEEILRGQAPDTPTLLENYYRLNPHSTPEWYMPIQLGNNAGSTLVRDSNSLGLLKSSNNLTEAEDVSKDSVQVFAFVLMGTEGHHMMGFIQVGRR